MKDLNFVRLQRLARTAIPALILTFIGAATLGCDSDQPVARDSSLRSDLAALHSEHDDSASIGSLDANAAPADFGRYRRVAFKPSMASRHPIR